MKALSLLQPWASLVVLGHKKVETRSWNTKYRGELLIHASKKQLKEIEKVHLCNHTHFGEVLNMDVINNLPFGAIIGKVSLDDVWPTEEVQHEMNVRDLNTGKILWEFNDQELAFGDYSADRYAWLLRDPVIFDKPISAKGSLSIWNYEGPLL